MLLAGTVGGEIGPQAVEVYQPLFAGAQKRPVGVLELYLPYAPIHNDVASRLNGFLWTQNGPDSAVN